VLATHPGDEKAKESAVVEREASAEPAAHVILAEPLWTKPYLAYLLHGELPEDAIHRRHIVQWCKSFTVIEGELYKRSTTGVL
jgi:hypothetical protein